MISRHPSPSASPWSFHTTRLERGLPVEERRPASDEIQTILALQTRSSVNFASCAWPLCRGIILLAPNKALTSLPVASTQETPPVVPRTFQTLHFIHFSNGPFHPLLVVHSSGLVRCLKPNTRRYLCNVISQMWPIVCERGRPMFQTNRPVSAAVACCISSQPTCCGHAPHALTPRCPRRTCISTLECGRNIYLGKTWTF